MSAFDNFDKVYCLNLPEREDRWQVCLENFKKYGIENVDRFPAIKANEELYRSESQKSLGQIGCALSFCSMFEDAIEKEYNSVLFLEDDFEFSLPKEELDQALNICFKELPKNWDMFYLGANVIDEILQKPLAKYSDNLYKVKSAYALHSVAISNKGLKKIKACFVDCDELNWGELMIANFEAIDVFFASHFQSKTNCFIPKKLLSLQRPDFSSIEGTFFDYQDLMLKRFEHFKNLIDE